MADQTPVRSAFLALAISAIGVATLLAPTPTVAEVASPHTCGTPMVRLIDRWDGTLLVNLYAEDSIDAVVGTLHKPNLVTVKNVDLPYMWSYWVPPWTRVGRGLLNNYFMRPRTGRGFVIVTWNYHYGDALVVCYGSRSAGKQVHDCHPKCPRTNASHFASNGLLGRDPLPWGAKRALDQRRSYGISP